MIPYSPLNDVNSTAKTMVDEISSEHNYFDSTRADMISQVQQSEHQVIQSIESFDWDQCYHEFLPYITEKLSTSTFTPFPLTNFSSIETQALGESDEFAQSTNEDLPLDHLTSLQLPSFYNVTSESLENCVAQPTNFLELYVKNDVSLDAQTVPHHETYQLDQQHLLMLPSSPPAHPFSLNVVSSPEVETSRKRKSSNANSVNKSKIRNGKLQHVCPVPGCEKVYINLYHFERHLDWHAGKNNFFCAHCDKGFVRKIALCFHIQTHMSSKERTTCNCPNCSVEGGNKTKDSYGRLQHICHIAGCGKVLSRIDNLKEHLRRHSSERSYFCTWTGCEKSFITKNDLVHHLKSHETQSECPCLNCSGDNGNKTKGSNGRLQHICHIPGCDQVYNRAANFRKHLKWHNGEKLHCCEWVACGKRFFSKFALSVHVRVHENPKVTEKHRPKEDSETKVFNGGLSTMNCNISTTTLPTTINVEDNLEMNMDPTSSDKKDPMDTPAYTGSMMIITPINNSILSPATDSSTCQTQPDLQASLTHMFVDELAIFVRHTHT